MEHLFREGSVCNYTVCVAELGAVVQLLGAHFASRFPLFRAISCTVAGRLRAHRCLERCLSVILSSEQEAVTL